MKKRKKRETQEIRRSPKRNRKNGERFSLSLALALALLSSHFLCTSIFLDCFSLTQSFSFLSDVFYFRHSKEIAMSASRWECRWREKLQNYTQISFDPIWSYRHPLDWCELSNTVERTLRSCDLSLFITLCFTVTRLFSLCLTGHAQILAIFLLTWWW